MLILAKFLSMLDLSGNGPIFKMHFKRVSPKFHGLCGSETEYMVVEGSDVDMVFADVVTLTRDGWVRITSDDYLKNSNTKKL